MTKVLRIAALGALACGVLGGQAKAAVVEGHFHPDTLLNMEDGLKVRNETGTTIDADKFVYVSGYSETTRRPLVALADIDLPNGRAMFILPRSLATATNSGNGGHAVKKHRIKNANTSGSTVGNPVFLSATAGGWTLTYPGIVNQVVGRVAVVSASVGEIEVDLESNANYTNNENTSTTFEGFRVRPSTTLATGAATSGSTGAVNVMNTGSNVFEYVILGAGQTITTPVLTAEGLNIGLDQTDAEGVEISQGITDRGPSAFTIGTSPAFFFSVKAKIEDASGASNFLVCFIKTAAYQADETGYSDYACIGTVGTANPNTIQIETEVNGGGTTTTDTTDTWADNATKTLRINVSSAGVVTYTINGAAPTATAAFTFDSTDVVRPAVYFLNGSDLAGEVELIEWTVGLQ